MSDRQPGPLSLTELIAHPDRILDVPVGAIPTLLVQLTTVAAQLAARAHAVALKQEVDGAQPSHDLVTVPEAAKTLGIAPSFLYEAIRLNRVPATRLGKYVRMHPDTVADIQRKGLDAGLSLRYTRRYGRRGAQEAAGSPDAGGIRRPTRRAQQYPREVRARRTADS